MHENKGIDFKVPYQYSSCPQKAIGNRIGTLVVTTFIIGQTVLQDDYFQFSRNYI